MNRRVVITGVGIVSPLGCAVEQVWQRFQSGTSGLQVLSALDGLDGRSIVGGAVTEFVARDHIDPKSMRLMSPAVTFGVAAAQLAAVDSGHDWSGLDPARLGAFIGSRGHSSDRQDLKAAVARASAGGHFRLDTFGSEGLPLVHPMWLLKGLANNVLYFVSLKYNAQGMNNNISMGGVAGTLAIGEAFRTIQHGHVDVAFAGAYDSALDADRLEMFTASGLFTRSSDARSASLPFDRRRDGFAPAEGAGFVVLETLESADRRGAKIYGEIVGYGCATVPGSPCHLGPSRQGFAHALRAALHDAAVDRPDAVFSFGLATPSSDRDETAALKDVFGAAAHDVPAPAVKSMTGNTFAASGVIEAAAALLSLRDQRVPPTINLNEPDPDCNLDYVAAPGARPMPLDTVALNNAGLGGAHAALVLRRS